MIVSGRVVMSITMNVIGLETDAVGYDRYGQLRITDPDRFFMDWDDEWNIGNGELLGASDMETDIEAEEDDEEDDEEDEEV